jgi:hypothetical protein
MYKQLLVLLIFVFFPLICTAENSRWYLGGDVVSNGIEIETQVFHPASARARFGGWIWENNIGIEIIAGGGVKDNDQAGLTMDVNRITAIAGRFQSPLDLGMRAYILLGYAENDIEASRGSNPFPGKETFTGGMAALGGLWPLTRSQKLSLSLEFTGYLTDDRHNIAMGSLGLGLFYDF